MVFIMEFKNQKMSKRIKLIYLKNCFLAVHLHFKCKRIAKSDEMSFEERYKFGQKFVSKFHKDGHIKIHSYGKDNVPNDLKGCLFVANHQGRDDALVILETLKDVPTSVVINDARSHMFLLGPICDMLKAKRIKFNNLRDQYKVYNEMTEEISNHNRRYIIFPEAGYNNNKNNLLEFHTPGFTPAIKAKAPLIPICLYDSYKIYDDKTLKEVRAECHILKPIYYDEYKDLTKSEVALLVKERIQNKLDEIKLLKV